MALRRMTWGGGGIASQSGHSWDQNGRWLAHVQGTGYVAHARRQLHTALGPANMHQKVTRPGRTVNATQNVTAGYLT